MIWNKKETLMERPASQDYDLNLNLVAIASTIFVLLYLITALVPIAPFYFLMFLFIWPSYLMYLLFGLVFGFRDIEGIALGSGVLMEFIGPIFVFICWFIILSIIGEILIKINPKFCVKIGLLRIDSYSKKPLVVCILITMVLTTITPIYFNIRSKKALTQYYAEKQQTVNDYANSYSGNYFEVPEINIKFKLPSNLNDLTYSVIQSDSTRRVIGFSSNSLSVYPGCSAENMPLGVIVRYPRSSKQNMVEITGYLLLDGPREYNLRCTNGCGYHPYSPYTMGNYYFFYDDPFEQIDNPKEPTYKGYQTHPLGYLSYTGACSRDASAANLQIKQLDLLKPALSTTNLIKN